MNKEKGFSLVELLVAITLFTLVVGSITGLSVAAIRSQAQSLVLQKLLDETSYVLEYMSRDLRMAKKNIASACFELEQGFNYQNPFGIQSAIQFINYQTKCRMLYHNIGPGNIMQDEAGIPSYQLTSNDVAIFFLNFNLSGQSQNETPNLQPRVTIVMTIRKAGATKPEIKIQTTISQRNLDVQE